MHPKGDLLLLTSKSEIQRLLESAVEATLSRALNNLPSSGQEPPKELLSNREAMEFLDLSKSTLQRWRDSGKLPFSKIESSIYYERAMILHVVREHRIDGAGSEEVF